MQVIGYGTQEASATLKPLKFNREPVRAGEIGIEITHCGVCHSDLHQARNDWENTVWPCIPGHEVVGTVTEVGEGVTKFKVGDRAGIGCMVNSCQDCEQCDMGHEQYCTGPKSCTLTYNGPKKPDGTNSYGGYSTAIAVREEFALTIPDAIESQHAAPILCAGITTFQPMKHFGLKEGQVLGVAGIGGLGHMAVQIGKALGAKVVALTTSPEKREAIEALGADEIVLMDDKDALKSHAQSIDLIVDTIPYKHDINQYLQLMAAKGQIAVVGNFLGFEDVDTATMVFQHVGITGSLIGGVPDTQEVLELCAKHGIRPQVEMIEMSGVNKAFERMQGEDVRFRHVIDMASLKNDSDAAESATRVDDPVRGEVVS
ncbi:NAD(P)-dependent alcohol dehydrogenase [Paraurantiacibacter namhicola]|uniref:NADP-dependent alcohol dehydrogenase C 2 n=1 Tax=Paraurantiacibacter namhicola TaxID=645517 RepID=A0A1C7DAZ3_9SPHN|nr:NAD(P)-dependent alcohol dehydrogenase [Paraurantiacibacter namhicola]ANU08463.1 NADP-dependent alcohol dehydrogenase C 2 [Paraurantiacibacter namhicola]